MILDAVIHLIFNGILPRQQVYISLDLLKLCGNPNNFRPRFSKNGHHRSINFVNLVVDFNHRGVEFVVKDGDKLEAHQILCGKTLQGFLRGVLCLDEVFVNFVLRAVVRARNGFAKTFKETLRRFFLREFVARRKSRRAFQSQAIEFETIVFVPLDKRVDLRIKFALFLRRQIFFVDVCQFVRQN